MHVYKFQVAEKDISPAAADCTARIHHKEFADQDLLTGPVTHSFYLECHRSMHHNH